MALAFLPRPSSEQDSVYRSVVVQLEKDHKLIYYDFRKELPEVSPANPTAKLTTPGPDALQSKQRIVANPDEKPGKQLVYIPEPRVKLQTELQSPNLIAVQPQIEVPLPDRPKPKPFQAPEAPKTTVQPMVALPSAPTVTASADPKDSELNTLLKKPVGPPPKQFVPPTQKPPVPSSAPASLPNAPTVATATADKNSSITALLDRPTGPPPKQFVPPTAKAARVSPAPTALPSAPEVTTGAADKNSAIASLLGRPVAGPLKPFNPPPARSPGTSTAGGASLPAAPPVAGGPPAPATVAIIGLNPANVPQIPVPEGSRPARIEAGTPIPGATRPELGGGNSGVSMPGVAIQGSPATSPATASRVPLDRQSPTGLATAHAPVVLPTTPHVSVPQWPATRHLPAAVDHHFQDRVVYLTSIPSQASDDWIVWFAELTAGPPDSNLVVHPPTLIKSGALPPFPARMDHGTGSVRLTGIIRQDGHLNGLTELAGGAADRELVEALETWQFTPARRNGVIFDADAVIEIPVAFGKLSQR